MNLRWHKSDPRGTPQLKTRSVYIFIYIYIYIYIYTHSALRKCSNPLISFYVAALC